MTFNAASRLRSLEDRSAALGSSRCELPGMHSVPKSAVLPYASGVGGLSRRLLNIDVCTCVSPLDLQDQRTVMSQLPRFRCAQRSMQKRDVSRVTLRWTSKWGREVHTSIPGSGPGIQAMVCSP